jgi:hypothetical protein
MNKVYKCKRCGRELKDWQVFETGWPNNIKYWCNGEYDHIPWFTKLKMKLLRKW